MVNYFKDTSLSPQKRAEALVDVLSIEEQATQLKYDAPAIERVGLKQYNWWNEGLHGVARAGTATMFPQAIALASMFDCERIKKVADITATEARAKYNAASKHGDYDIYKGLTIWSPNINIFRDPRWGRGHETYGEDPFLTSRLGVSFVKGLQGEEKTLKTAACAKHFAVHSGPESLRHEFNAIVSPKDLEETYLPAFETLVKEGKVESVMGAYNRVNGEPACASIYLFNKLKEWGFNGYFVSDCWAISDFHTHHLVTSNASESAALALKLGCDLNCGNTYLHIISALNQGLVETSDIRKACVNLMRTRIRLGMLDDKTPFDDIPYNVVSSKEHKLFSQECAEKSMVLLKNSGILPLSDDKSKTIAVIGPNANSRDALTGNYCGTADRYTTFLEGIQDRFSGDILYSEGCHLYKDRVSGLALSGDRYAEAVYTAENSDIVILCIGLDSTIEGEEGDTGNEFFAGDKTDLRLPEPQRKLINKIKEVGKPLVVILSSGSSINIESDCEALIETWYPGQRGGTALANILFGDVSPSGKLPITFYESTELLPNFKDYEMENRTYRYVTNNILYPFGYGLTYSKGKVSCSNLSYQDNTATFTVENNSNIDIEEIVQLYIKDYSQNAVKNYSLCGFKRVCISKNSFITTTIGINKKAFTSVDENGVRGTFGKKFTLYAGICQPDSLSESLTGTKCVSVDINF
ncbi:MAG: glycoside hydrolase family 3 protein [Clostridiales bacterium]|nr:glycoside hydrolase family 3 protein [Clostridiales bacterium]